jgi:predicted nucleic acid-binding protein
MSGDKIFVDTNILVYAYDPSAGTKHDAARNALADLWTSGLGVVSTQVLQEFFVTVTRKLPNPMAPGIARDIISDMMKWDVVTIEPDMILDAIDLQQGEGFSFWDCLIIAAAERGRCGTLFSEDFSSGRIVGKITIINPL